MALHKNKSSKRASASKGAAKPKFMQSPDRYDPTSMGERPTVQEYTRVPENLNTAQTPQKAGQGRGSIQQSDGVASPRAENKTKSASMPGEKSGGTKWPGLVDSYGESAGETV